MRTQTAIIVFAILAICLVKRTESQVCTAPNTPAGCTDCTLPANAANALCTTTTVAPTTTTAAAGVTTTTSASATTTTTAAGATTTTARPTNIRRLIRRLRILRRSLNQCRANAARERAALLKKIKALQNSNNGNSIKNKLFG